MMKKLFYVFTTLLLLIGNFAFAQTFVVCDTECRSTPLGDCASGHTDTDNIEWPCDIILDNSSVFVTDVQPDDLETLAGVDSLDARPNIVGIANPSSIITMTWQDVVLPYGNGFKILREFTLLDWLSGNVYTYNQLIKNSANVGVACGALTCNANTTVQLSPNFTPPSVDIGAYDILVGSYALCDVASFILEIADNNGTIVTGTGTVTTTEIGVFTLTVTDPSTGNTCWGVLAVNQATTTSTGCEALVCNSQINVSLAPPTGTTPASATLWTADLLSGSYSCDLDTMWLVVYNPDGTEYTSGIGSVTITDPGNYSYEVVEPFINNTCWGNLVVNSPNNGGSCTLACNNEIMVALAATATGPSATLVSDVFLEGAYPNCDINSFSIVVSDNANNTIASGIGRVTVTGVGTFQYSITDPATGNTCWGTIIVEDKSNPCNDPFEICDTECRSTPIGDCASGHTDTDNIEWPCDVILDDASISSQDVSPSDLESIVDLMDARPTILNEGCNLIGMTFADLVFQSSIDGFKILRTWTLLNWHTGDAFEYIQEIKNLSGPIWSNCTLACNDQVMVALGATTSGPSATLDSDVFLEGAYPNCDITTFEITATDAAGNTITGIGSITLTVEGTFTYTITDPATGNQCWGTMIVEYRGGTPCNDPFDICDTECRSTSVGDCASGHTDTDNVEWPCDITLDDATISSQQVSPDDLLSLVDSMDTRPTLVNVGCNLIGTAFNDQVIDLGSDGFKILRTWTLVHWNTGNGYEYIQLIKNNSGLISDCGMLVCNDMIYASLAQTTSGLSATLDSDVFLEGGYPNCDLSTLEIVVTDAAGNNISGTGNVTVTEEGSYTYIIADPVTGNLCWGNLIVENKNPASCPFVICDTECRIAPLGDCASGHTDSDNVEWPCDITLDIAGLTAQNLSPHDLLSVNGVDERDAEPVLVNHDPTCHIVGMNWHDTVIDDGTNGFRILRVWTIINWETTAVYEYSQIIKNLSPGIQSICKPLECQNITAVGLGTPGSELTITAHELLEGNYPNCDLEGLGIKVLDHDNSTLATGIGQVVLKQTGTMFYSVAELETNNFCRGEIMIEPAPSSSSVEEANALAAIKVYPNPATDVLLLDYKKLDLKGDVSISIIDQSGRTLLQEINNNRLNISKLNNGLYIYQIRVNDEVRHGKFTVFK